MSKWMSNLEDLGLAKIFKTMSITDFCIVN